MNIKLVRFPSSQVLGRVSITIVIALGLSACVSMPPNDEQTTSTALNDTDSTALGQVVTEAVAANHNKNGVLLLGNGLDAHPNMQVRLFNPFPAVAAVSDNTFLVLAL